MRNSTKQSLAITEMFFIVNKIKHAQKILYFTRFFMSLIGIEKRRNFLLSRLIVFYEAF